ncbi:MAG: cell wall metabolism sensor histidine kinase WalK, partial [Bacteroidota bacterium]|nr:cell wall metabolism sensor histidine kinase WalK [Bacteroidota bacterium]
MISKNATINSIAALITIFVTSIIFVLLISIKFGLISLNYSWVILISLVVIGLISFFSTRGILEKYVFRKIKLIYKMISEQKSDDKYSSKQINPNIPFMDKVQAEVEDWIDRKNENLAQQKILENYRKEYVGNVSHELKTPTFNI